MMLHQSKQSPWEKQLQRLRKKAAGLKSKIKSGHRRKRRKRVVVADTRVHVDDDEVIDFTTSRLIPIVTEIVRNTREVEWIPSAPLDPSDPTLDSGGVDRSGDKDEGARSTLNHSPGRSASTSAPTILLGSTKVSHLSSDDVAVLRLQAKM
jgi:hypothetical protein